MRSDTLHAALRAFAEEAAAQLSDDTAHGAEVPFELEESGPPTRRRRTPLYCYRPLVDEFLRERDGALARLPAHAPAVRALAEHADRLPAYLKALASKASPDPQGSLHAFLGRLFADQTEFALDGGRFDRAYAQLEEALFAGRTDA